MVLGLVTAAACGSDDGGGVSGGYSIGLVTDTGKVDDKSFNQSAWEGATRRCRYPRAALPVI